MKKLIVIILTLIFLTGCIDQTTMGKKELHCNFINTEYIYIYDEDKDESFDEEMDVEITTKLYSNDDFIYRIDTIHTIDTQENMHIIKHFENSLMNLYYKMGFNIRSENKIDDRVLIEYNQETLEFKSTTEFYRKNGPLYKVNPYNDLSLAYQMKWGGPLSDIDVCELVE